MVIRELLEMLSWCNQKGWPRKASNTQKRVVMIFQVVFLNWCSHASKDEASQPQQESALDHKWYSFYMGEEWNSTWYLLVFTKLIIGLHIDIEVMNWNLCDYPLLQHSKDIIVICMIISSLTSMRLVHIVHAS